MTDINHYLGNPLLKKANVQVEWTKDQILEYQKCMQDPLYFCQKYIKIVSLDEGLVPFDVYPFQKEILGTIHNNRFTICKLPRQSGKTTTIISYILHYVLFNEQMRVADTCKQSCNCKRYSFQITTRIRKPTQMVTTRSNVLE